MSSHAISVAGYLAIVASGGGLQLVALRRGSLVPTLGQALRRAMRTRSGRTGIVAGWAWFGLHLFAR